MAYNPQPALGQAAMTASLPVAIASDQSAVPVGASTTGGLLATTGAIKDTATAVKGSAGQVYGWYFYNSNNAVVYVQIFNEVAASVTVGTTTPAYILPIPPLSGANAFGLGITHGTGISLAITTSRTTGAPTNNVDYSIFYK